MVSTQQPDAMAGYLTYELSQLLGKLTAQQRAAVARIVEHHYIANRPLAELFRGENPICAERRYYGQGRVDPETGKAHDVGWSHQPAFADALAMAARLALQTKQNEEINAVREAVRRARLAAAPVIGKLAQIAIGPGQTKTIMPDGSIVVTGKVIEDRDRIAAGKYLVEVALKNTEFGERESTDGLESDWWRAVEDER